MKQVFSSEKTGGGTSVDGKERITNKRGEPRQFFSRRNVLKWAAALVVATETWSQSLLANALRPVKARSSHVISARESDLLIDLENVASATLPPFGDASGTLHVVDEGNKRTISWHSP